MSASSPRASSGSRARGRSLKEPGPPAPQAFRGVSVSGFLILFMLPGPKTDLGLNFITFMIDCRVRHTLGCLDEMRRRGLRTLDVKPERMREYNDEAQA